MDSLPRGARPHRRRRPKRHPPATVKPSRDRRLMALDTGAIREETLRAYRKAGKNVEKLRRDLNTFREHDVPGFRSWLHGQFGAELTQQREIQQAIDEKRSLLLEVEDVATRFRLSDGAAYRKTLWRRANPDAAEAEDRAFEERLRREREARKPGERDPFGVGEEDGCGPDDEFDEAFDDDMEDAFRAFVEDMAGFHRHGGSRSAPGAPPEDVSLKEAYRSIVRRLHPDRSGSFSDVEKELWHDAQAAYKRGDLHALQKVLAHCEAGTASVGPTSAVSLIRRLIRDLRNQAQALRDELRDAKTDPAWSFTKHGHTPGFTSRIRRWLDSDRYRLSWVLRDMKAMIADLERMSGARPPRKRRKKPQSPEQSELPF